MTKQKGYSSGLVDFHCHLDLYPDHLGLMAKCENSGIETLTVTNAPSVWPKNRELAQGYKHVRVGLGLHPELAAERQGEMELFERYLAMTRYVGEVGLDGSPWLRKTFETQERVFSRILKLCADHGDKVLTVHSRRAVAKVIGMLKTDLTQRRGRVVLHWFTGTKKQAREAAEWGCFFSVNTKMLESSRGRELVSSFPRDRVLTESDGPFVKLEEKLAEPHDVETALRGLAGIWGMENSAAAAQVSQNLERLLA